VDGAGAEVCAPPPAELLLLELHAAAAAVSVRPATSAGMALAARPVPCEARW